MIDMTIWINPNGQANFLFNSLVHCHQSRIQFFWFRLATKQLVLWNQKSWRKAKREGNHLPFRQSNDFVQNLICLLPCAFLSNVAGAKEKTDVETMKPTPTFHILSFYVSKIENAFTACFCLLFLVSVILFSWQHF